MERKEKRQPDHSSLRHDIGNRDKLTREACDSHLRIPLGTPGTMMPIWRPRQKKNKTKKRKKKKLAFLDSSFLTEA